MENLIDTSVGTVCSTYSVDIPRYWHGHISIVQMITLVRGVEIWYSARVYSFVLVKLHSGCGTSKSSEYGLTIALSNNIIDSSVP